MSEYLTLSVVSASAVYTAMMLLVFAVVYGIGLLIEWRRRRYMYWLRTHEKRGKALAAEGYTLDNLSKKLMGNIEGECDE